MKTLRYEFEVTTFAPGLRHERFICNLSQAIEAVHSLPGTSAVIYVAALGDRVDYGNFYCFLNESGAAHVMLHEHRDVCARDPASELQDAQIAFFDEDCSRFVVEGYLTTSGARAKEALRHWLPDQTHWPEFTWQHNRQRSLE